MITLYCKSCESFPEHIIKKETFHGSTEEPPEYNYYCECGAELSEEESFICDGCGLVKLEEQRRKIEELNLCLECWGDMEAE